MKFPDTVQALIDSFTTLPGIGKKSAERFAFFLLGHTDQAKTMHQSLGTLIEKIHQCSICGNIAEQPECPICRDRKRDPKLLCVVETFKDLYAIEASSRFPGRYHLLMGLVSPLEGVTPGKLRMKELYQRATTEPIREVVLALSSTTEGDATCLYIKDLLKPLGIKVTRLPFGLSIGSDIAHVDQTTLGRALDGRTEV